MIRAHAALTLGSLLYDTHAVRLRLRRTLLPAVDRLEIELPRDVRFEAQPGDDAILELGGESDPVKVFTGRVSAVKRTLRSIVVTAHDGGLELARYRPSMTMEAVEVGEIVRALCGDGEVDLGALEDGPKLALYVADGRASAAEEIARLAAFCDAVGSFDGDGKLHVEPFESSGHAGELAWKYGREVIDAELERWNAEANSMTLVGEGGGDPGSGRALWLAKDFLAGAAPSAGVDARLRAEPLLRTVDDARAASGAWMQRRARAQARVKVLAWLNPSVTAGSRLEIQELPDAIGPTALVARQVVHELDPRAGAFTHVWGAEKGAGADLLGALLGALGSLL